MRVFLFLVAGVVAMLGTAAFAVGWNRGDDVLLQEGSKLIVAALVLTGVAAGISTWRAERRKALDQKQRETYGTLVLQLVSRFTGLGTWDAAVEARVRAETAVWADAEVVKKLQAWNATFNRNVGSVPPGAVVALSPDQAAEFRTATAEVARSVRRQFSKTESVSVADLEGALFNQI